VDSNGSCTLPPSNWGRNETILPGFVDVLSSFISSHLPASPCSCSGSFNLTQEITGRDKTAAHRSHSQIAQLPEPSVLGEDRKLGLESSSAMLRFEPDGGGRRSRTATRAFTNWVGGGAGAQGESRPSLAPA